MPSRANRTWWWCVTHTHPTLMQFRTTSDRVEQGPPLAAALLGVREPPREAVGIVRRLDLGARQQVPSCGDDLRRLLREHRRGLDARAGRREGAAERDHG